MSLLELEGVGRRFGGLRAVDEVSFEVEQGQIRGLIGPNGAGKSTLFSLIAGSIRPSSGHIRYGSRDVTGWTPHEAAAAGVARTFQLMRVFSSMTVLQNLVVGGYLRHRRRSEARARALEVLEMVGLAEQADTPARSLTVASKKRLEIARALATGPQLLLLDETLSGLTPVEGREAVEVVRQINASGVTIVMVEHVMEVVMPLCDRVVVLNHGRLIREGTPAEVTQDQAVIEAYLGIRR
ncbi:MAG: ABC transporter ATP-binding protein [Acidimicrobiales bacterium]